MSSGSEREPLSPKLFISRARALSPLPPGPETRAGMRHSVPEVVVGDVPGG